MLLLLNHQSLSRFLQGHSKFPTVDVKQILRKRPSRVSASLIFVSFFIESLKENVVG